MHELSNNAQTEHHCLPPERTHAENTTAFEACKSSPATIEPDGAAPDIFRKCLENLEMSSRVFFHRHSSFPPIGPRPRYYEHAKCTDRKKVRKSGRGISQYRSPSIRTRAQLLRLRLQSPARRRNSSAEWPGPSNGTSTGAHHPAMQMRSEPC